MLQAASKAWKEQFQLESGTANTNTQLFIKYFHQWLDENFIGC